MDQNDINIMVTMSLAVILISFAFPAVGFTHSEVGSSEVPEFNATKDQYDFLDTAQTSVAGGTGNLPTGTLVNNADKDVDPDRRQIYLIGDSSAGASITLVNFNGTTDPEPEVNINTFKVDGTVITNSSFINESETVQLATPNDSIIVKFDNLQIEDEGESNMTITVDWTVLEYPGPGTGEGGDAGAIDRIRQIIAIPINLLIGLANIFVIVKNGIFFAIDLGWFVTSNYSSVILNAPTGWVRVLMTIPGLILSLQFIKILAVFTSKIAELVPFT